MHLITIDHLTVNYAGRQIFADLAWAVADRDRVGLVGPNGAGKSSLLKVITGVVTPEAGSVVIARGATVGYLPQQVTLEPGRLIDVALHPPPELAAVEADLARIEARLADPDVYGDEKRLTRTLEQHERALHEYERLGGPRHQSRVRELLAMLGFDEGDYDLPTEALSGGQKKLVALARLAAEAPTVLLLDEPDNHLDLAAKRRLEQFITGYAGAVVIVSHDRYLLDEVATCIAELEEGKLNIYPGNYSAYVAERALRRLRQQQMYVAQQKRIQQIEEAIARFERWAHEVVNERHARQARSRRKMLDRMEERGEIIEKVTDRRPLEMQFEGWRGSNKAIELIDLAMGFDYALLFLDLNLMIRHGERVGLVGPNGAGKSVLFKLILGQLEPLAGHIRIGPSTRIGYYAQEHETLAAWWGRTPLERIRDIQPMSEGEAVSFLLKFQFQYEQLRMPIGTMSGGERSRVQLAGLMLQKPNLLLLDEPTNNLDIPSAEALEAALEDFEGAVLTISHDRYFLDQVVDRVVELRDGTLTGFPGGYTDFLAARAIEA